MARPSLINSAEKNDVEGIKKLLQLSYDINQFDYGRSALHAACISNALGAAEYLVKNGANVNLRDEHTGATPLHYCAFYNWFEIANMILDNKGLLNIEDNYGNQPLWTAVLNVKGKDERLPLIELFLLHGADKNHLNNVSRSPLDFVNQLKFQPLKDLLIKY